MSRHSRKLPETELAICHRLRMFRQSIMCSQSEIAKKIGVSRNVIANAESGRTPINVGLASKVFERYALSPEWLVAGFGNMIIRAVLPAAITNPTNRNSLLSDVYLFDEKIIEKRKAEDWETGINSGAGYFFPPDSVGRVAAEEWMIRELRELLATVPDDLANTLLNATLDFAERIAKQAPGDALSEVGKRRTENEAARLNLYQRRSLLKRDLTNTATLLESESVNGKWLNLKKQIQKATADTGAKSKLAKFLGVDLTQLSKWLTDSDSAREPGAEYTLQMQAWVKDPKRQ